MALQETLMSLSDVVNADEIRHLPVEWVYPSENQQRKHFSEKELQKLTNSIKHMGIRIPIEVKEIISDERYQIISGERRYRSALKAELKTVPAIIRKNVTETSVVESQFAENILRQDLNAVEKALAIVQLMKIEGYNQKKIGEICGKSESWVSKQLKILDQPPEIQDIAKEGLLRDLNALYEIADLPDDERDHVISQIKKGNFNYKAYKKEHNKFPKKEDSIFNVTVNELKKIIKNTAFEKEIKKKNPGYEKATQEEMLTVFKQFKQWLNA